MMSLLRDLSVTSPSLKIDQSLVAARVIVGALVGDAVGPGVGAVVGCSVI